MNLDDVRSAISGRRVDVDGGKWFGARLLHDGAPT